MSDGERGGGRVAWIWLSPDRAGEARGLFRDQGLVRDDACKVDNVPFANHVQDETGWTSSLELALFALVAA